MISRSYIRRLERLETRLGMNRKRGVRIEYYDISPDGTLLHLRSSDDDAMEGDLTIQVIFVDSDGNSGPGPRFRALEERRRERGCTEGGTVETLN
ncbi:MAG TPA: hypothetical protein VIW68_05755 [Candidatus Sulfotelmatobacter sp.]